jgi:perosamine synthetase
MKTTTRNKFFTIFSKLRAIPPAGSSLSPFSLFPEILYLSNPLKLQIRSLFPNHEIYFLNSGKAALQLVLEAIRFTSGRNSILMSAYTCPDIATAAIRSNCKIALFDIDEKNMQPKSETFFSSINPEETASIIFSNLYGIPDRIPEDLPKGIYVIDDACQSALSIRENSPLGVSSTDIGIYSFGRGKAFSSAGGGILIIPRTDLPEKELYFSNIHRELRNIYTEIDKENYIDSILYFIKMCLLWIFEKPVFFWIALLIPMLKIGETKLQLAFSIRRPSRITLVAMLACLKKKSQRAKMLKKILLRYPDSLTSHIAHQSVHIRFPMLLSEEKKKNILKNKNHRRLGISGSYPKTIDKYPEISAYIINNGTNHQGAEKIAKKIITLPIHNYVKDDDINRILNLIY